MRQWSAHIQAQTDAFANKITVVELDDIFARTRKAGEEDVKQYAEAVKRYKGMDSSCERVSGAPVSIARQLAGCSGRGRAQRPVLAAAEAGMADWRNHLGDMNRSEKGKIHNPLAKWLRTWRAAPTNITAYKEAVDKFSAPDC